MGNNTSSQPRGFKKSKSFSFSKKKLPKFTTVGDVSIIPWESIIHQFETLLLCPGCLQTLKKPLQFKICKHLICQTCSEKFKKCPLELDASGNYYPKHGTLKSFFLDPINNTPLPTEKPWFFVDGIVSRIPEAVKNLKKSLLESDYNNAISIVEEISDEFICPICSGPLGNQNSVAVKPCTHMVCSLCLQKWFNEQHRSECPVCNTPIQKKKVGLFSSKVVEVIDSSPLGSFERTLLAQIPKLLIQLITLACAEDFQVTQRFQTVQSQLYELVKENQTTGNSYLVDGKRNGVLISGLPLEILRSTCLPAEIQAIGAVLGVKVITFDKKSGHLTTMVTFDRTEDAQKCMAYDDLYIQGYPVSVRNAPYDPRLYEIQLMNALSLAAVSYHRFDAKYLPFLKQFFGNGKDRIPEEMAHKYFQYNLLCFNILLEYDEISNHAQVRFQCPMFVKEKVLFDLDEICRDDYIMGLMLEGSTIKPEDVEIGISLDQVWKNYSLIIQNNIVFGNEESQQRLFNDYRVIKVEEQSDEEFQSAASDDKLEKESLDRSKKVKSVSGLSNKKDCLIM